MATRKKTDTAPSEVPAPDRPTIGCIVHYVDEYYFQHHAAIVTKVYGDAEYIVALAIFGQPGLGTVSDDRVMCDPSGIGPATWHWPERDV